MAESILMVEDEAKIARVLTLELQHEGYQTETAADGHSGLEQMRTGSWDLILLDIMLPELSGIEVLRRMRAAGDVTPVILLTAKDAVPDVVNGLDHGANDYVTKPFEIEELFARIRACLRTAGDSRDARNLLSVGDLSVNKGTREVERDGQTIELTRREFDLLVYLMENNGQVLEREQIIHHVWGYDFFGDTNVVDVYVRYLRKKVDAGFETPLIRTVRGVGYNMKGSET